MLFMFRLQEILVIGGHKFFSVCFDVLSGGTTREICVGFNACLVAFHKRP